MRLYRYTCDHCAQQIGRTGELRGNPHPYLPSAGPLTDLDLPDRLGLGLGLTSRILACDRTEYRCTVDTDQARHWPLYARTMNRATRELFEQVPGALPMHWWVAGGPIPVAAIERAAVTAP